MDSFLQPSNVFANGSSSMVGRGCHHSKCRKETTKEPRVTNHIEATQLPTNRQRITYNKAKQETKAPTSTTTTPSRTKTRSPRNRQRFIVAMVQSKEKNQRSAVTADSNSNTNNSNNKSIALSNKRKRRERKPRSGGSSSNNKRSHVAHPTSKTVRDIQRTLRALHEYVRGSNDYHKTIGDLPPVTLPPQFTQIPDLLLGLLGSHCQTDYEATSWAAKGIAHYASTSSSNSGTNPHRCTILRNEFHNSLRTWGTENVLTAIQKMGPSLNRNYNNPNTTNPGTTATATTATPNPSAAPTTSTSNAAVANKNNASRQDAILACWKVILAGTRAGLSRKTLWLVVKCCLTDLDEIPLKALREEQGNRNRHSHILPLAVIIIRVLRSALARPELLLEDMVPEHNWILSSCLRLLAEACMCGKTREDFANNHKHKTRNGNENENATGTGTVNKETEEHDGNAIPLIEDILGVLVVCGRRRLLVGSDYEKLLPGCKASLTRFVLSSNPVMYTEEHLVTKSIPVQVIQLVETEDKTIGLWLRETYKIPPPKSIGSSSSSAGDGNFLQQQTQQQLQGGGPFGLDPGQFFHTMQNRIHENPVSSPGNQQLPRGFGEVPPIPPQRPMFRRVSANGQGEGDESSEDEDEEGCNNEKDAVVPPLLQRSTSSQPFLPPSSHSSANGQGRVISLGYPPPPPPVPRYPRVVVGDPEETDSDEDSDDEEDY